MSRDKEQTLTIRIGAQVSQALSGINKLGERVNRLGRNMQRTGRMLSRNLTAPIVAVGAAMGATALRAGRMADELLDLEQQTGISTTALQEYRRVAAAAGVDQDVVARAAEQMTLRLSRGAEGSADLRLALEQMGIAARGADGNLRPMDQVVGEAITKLASMEDVTQRNVLATKLFSRGASELAPVLGLGAEEIDRLRSEAHDLGLVLGRDSLEGANDFRKEVDLLKERFSALANEAGIALVPIMQDVGAIISDRVIPAVRGAIERFQAIDPAVVKLAASVAGVVAAVGPFLLVMGKVVSVLALVLSPAGLVIAALATLTGIVVTLVQNWDRFLTFWVDLWVSIQEMALGSIGRIIGGFAELTDGIPGLGRVVGAVGEQFEAFASRSLAATNEAADRLRTRLKGTGDDMEETGETARSLADSVNGLGQEIDTTTGGVEGMQEGVKGLRPELEELEGGLVGVQGRIQAISPAMAESATTISDLTRRSTEDVRDFTVRSGKNLKDLSHSGGMAMSELGRTMQSIAGRGADAIFDFASGARGAIRSFVSDALRQLAKLAASRLFKLAIGGLTGGSSGVLGGIFGGFFADGGVLGAGRFGIAGEAGPELVTAGASPVRITPLSEIGGGSGGGGGAGNVASEILRRIGPPPSVHTPEGVATDAWWRRAFDALARDGERRGSL